MHLQIKDERDMETALRRLLEQIEEEYNAIYCGMNAFSSGAARHAFITARMVNIDTCRIELAALVGEEEALRLMVQGNNEGNNQG